MGAGKGDSTDPSAAQTVAACFDATGAIVQLLIQLNNAVAKLQKQHNRLVNINGRQGAITEFDHQLAIENLGVDTSAAEIRAKLGLEEAGK